MSRIGFAAVVTLLAFATSATAALAHGGGGIDYTSEVRSVTPARGLDVEVLDRDDRLALRNDSGETVVVEGYDGEPYVRLKPDGTVEVNANSPTLYLNEDRFGDVELPARAEEDAAPDWQLVDRSGRFEWHDHRIHWMGADRPPIVEDPQRRTKVFDWKVPLRVGGSPASATGTLTWVGRADDGFPVAAAIALGAVVAAGLVVVSVVRRRRRGRSSEAW